MLSSLRSSLYSMAFVSKVKLVSLHPAAECLQPYPKWQCEIFIWTCVVACTDLGHAASLMPRCIVHTWPSACSALCTHGYCMPGMLLLFQLQLSSAFQSTAC